MEDKEDPENYEVLKSLVANSCYSYSNLLVKSY